MTSTFTTQTQFWDKDQPRVLGDFIARPAVIDELEKRLGSLKGKRILEMGCGTGYMARLIAEKGAEVTGIDANENMFRKAEERERNKPLGIKYELIDARDIRKLFCDYFDAITAVGLFLHNEPRIVKNILHECLIPLKERGYLITSGPHPSRFSPNSPTRIERPCWAEDTPLTPEVPLSQSQQFHQTYKDIDGNAADLVIWHHPTELYLRTAKYSSLNLLSQQDIPVKKEDLKHPSWGNSYGYPAFQQLTFELKLN